MDLPDELASELERHARRNGRSTAEEFAHLVRLALLIEELPLVNIGRLTETLLALQDARNRASHVIGPTVIQTNPVTGMPVIISPPDAPIHSMSVQDVLALEQSILNGEDLQRASIPL